MHPFYIPHPVSMNAQQRTEMTVSCKDCDAIPKVDEAGCLVKIDGQSVQIMHNGVRVLAGGYHGDWMANVITRLRGHHEPQEELVFYEILKYLGPTSTMLELGGFWSYYSLWFLLRNPQRKSIVVEPDPNNLEVGKRNAALNGGNIEFLHACIAGTSKASVKFFTETAGSIPIRQVSVPDLLVELDISHLDVLHCDTQGAEREVIESCEALFRTNRITFGVFSTHSHHITGDFLTHQRCLAMLEDFGGKILAEHDVHESFSGDGLIVVYFGNAPLRWASPSLSRNRYSKGLFRNPLYDLYSTTLENKAAPKLATTHASTALGRLASFLRDRFRS